MSRTIHCCLSLRGALPWSEKEMRKAATNITRADGSRMTSRELRATFVDLLASGNEVIPVGEACSAFNPKTGCEGHEELADLFETEEAR